MTTPMINELVERIYTSVTSPDNVAAIEDRLQYSNVFSIVVSQIHPLCHAGLSNGELQLISRILSDRLGFETFYQYGEVFCKCTNTNTNNTNNTNNRPIKRGIFTRTTIRELSTLSFPPMYSVEDAQSDIDAVVNLYHAFKSVFDSELALRHRVRMHVAKCAKRAFSISNLFKPSTVKPSNVNVNKNNNHNNNNGNNNNNTAGDGGEFEVPLRINQLNYDPYIREDQWKRRVAPDISAKTKIAWIEIQGAYITIGDVILTIST